MLPTEVLERAQQEMVDWNGTGMSVMEMSHRGKEFMSIAEKAEADLRQLMAIPDNYKVLFLQGGASSQFAMVPINLLNGKKTADYMLTGQWSKKAISEANRYCDVNLLTDTSASKFTTVPDEDTLAYSKDAAYVHYTPNETIVGVEFPYIPDTGDVPLVADMSSTILSHPIDVSKFGVIYAGAQKNIGPAGVCLVIIRKDMLARVPDALPTMLKYTTYAAKNSLYNTPPSFAVYTVQLVLKWLEETVGGLENMATLNRKKAQLLYDIFDNSQFYRATAEPDSRSQMNVTFRLPNEELEQQFIGGALENSLGGLKGHRSVGGCRASIYNAVSSEAVAALADFMATFEKENG